MTEMIERPIFIIGAARSGTSMLGEIISHHPALAYWLEPKYIWRYGNPRSPTDAREADEATPRVAAYIQRRLVSYTRRHGGQRCLEKTPSNTLRVTFMNRIFPQALFLHIVRDGRDVAFSAAKKWSSPPHKAGLWRRMGDFSIPLRDAPSYAIDFLRDVVGRQLRPHKGYIWGPHTPDLRAVRGQHSLLATCGIQWRDSVESALRGLAEVPASRQYTVRFEDLVADPKPLTRQILDFTGLEPSDEVVHFAGDFVRPEVSGRWRERPTNEVEPLLPHIREALDRLGYL